MRKVFLVSLFGAASLASSGLASAACTDVTSAAFKAAADLAATQTADFGFGLPMWASMVDETGKVCYVYAKTSGATAGNFAWLGSRVISVQKAFTANAFSLNELSIPTGGVYAAVQPGGSLFGLQFSNPVDAATAYSGTETLYGTAETDPLVGKRIGGVNVFGGGVALYKVGHVKVGAVGVSGDTSCRDHAFAYRLRTNLALNNPPADDRLKLVTKPSALYQQPKCGVKDPTGLDNGIAK